MFFRTANPFEQTTNGQHVHRDERNVKYPARYSVFGSGLGTRMPGLVNSLTYTYSGNRVQSILDGGSGKSTLYGDQAFLDGDSRNTEYLYDKNGNMTTDYNKGIAKVNYNVLNLPGTIQFKQGNNIAYGYDASGTKRTVTTVTAKEGVTVPMETIGQISPSDVLFTNREDYSGNAVYAVYLNESPVILRLYTPEGYVYRWSMNSGEWLYHYNLKDHSGSVRYTFQGDGTNIGYTHYYPSGVEFADLGSPGRLVDRRRFNDKELQSDFGLNWYDFVARGYDPAVVRPWQIDPLAEKRPWESPYLWCGGNPMNAIDPDGRDYYVMTGDGRMVLALKTDDNYDRLFAVQGERQNNVVYKIEDVTGSLRVNDQGILSALSENPDAKIHYTLTDSRSDALNVFKFAADNTNVEWGVDKFTEDGKTRYSVKTMHEYNHTSGAKTIGRYSETSVIAAIHSHPGAEPDRDSEWTSMRYQPWVGNERNIYDRYDYDLKTDPKYSYYPNSSYYIYMKKSHRVWQIGNIRGKDPVSKGYINIYNNFAFF